MSTPLISVILPIYKVEEYLDRCVNSLLAQSYPHLEIILVDDGSPDRCPQLCDEWAKKDPRIRVVHKKNGGLSDARNAGYAVSSGELISFIDSDDWVEPDFFRILYDALSKTQSDVSSCEYRKTYGDETPPPTNTDYHCRTLPREDAMSDLIDNKVQQVVWNKLYRRSVIDGVLFDVGKYHEDEFWTYRVIGNCSKLAITDYTGLNYFQRTDSIMGESYSLKRIDAIEAKVRRQAYLKQSMAKLCSKGNFNLLFACMYHGQLTQKYLSGKDKKKSIDYLRSVIRQHPMPLNQMSGFSVSHRGWLWLCQRSFSLTCALRNLLKIGM